MLKRILAGLIVAVGMGSAAVAEPLDDAFAAYEHGDYATALSLLRPLAEQGHASAQFTLGVIYGKGEGVPQDHAEEAKWYRRAAEQGDASAQFNLGLMYGNGEGVPQDHAEAAKWYRRAAEQGDASAQFALGVMYGNGEGVPQDIVLAHVWWNLAGAQGHERAKKYRDIAAGRMTPDQLAEAQRLTREWKPAAER